MNAAWVSLLSPLAENDPLRVLIEKVVTSDALQSPMEIGFASSEVSESQLHVLSSYMVEYSPCVTSIDLSNNALRARDAAILADAVGSSRSLERLDLRGNAIGNCEDGQMLADALLSNSALTSLNGRCIDGTDVAAFANGSLVSMDLAFLAHRFKQGGSTITSLDLSCNNFLVGFVPRPYVEEDGDDDESDDEEDDEADDEAEDDEAEDDEAEDEAEEEEEGRDEEEGRKQEEESEDGTKTKVTAVVDGAIVPSFTQLISALNAAESLQKLFLRECALRDDECAILSSMMASNHSLQLLDLEGNRITDAGIDTIAGSFRTGGAHVRSLNVRGNCCGDTAMAVLGAALLKNETALQYFESDKWSLTKGTQHFDLYKCSLSSSDVIMIAGLLTNNHEVCRLSLGENDICNAVGGGRDSRGIKALAQILRINTTLTHLELQSCDVRHTGLEILLGDGASSLGGLRRMDLSGSNNLGGRCFAWQSPLHASLVRFGGVLMAKGGLIREIDLSYSMLGSDGAAIIANWLQGELTLFVPFLALIAEFLHVLDSILQSLALRGTMLLDRSSVTDAPQLHGFKQFCEALRSSALEELDVSENALGPQGLSILAEHLPRALSSLHVAGNFVVGVEYLGSSMDLGAVQLLLGRIAVQRLNLSQNMLAQAGAELLARYIETNLQVRELNICGCSLGVDGVKRVATAVTVNKTLHTLQMSANKAKAQGARALIKALSANPSLQVLSCIPIKRIREQFTLSIVRWSDLNLADMGIGDAEAQILIHFIRGFVSKLALLDLRWNPISRKLQDRIKEVCAEKRCARPMFTHALHS
jgi:Ran GTPase-activating protein (RanGAP) involved in mRNA processing and transport